MVFLIWASVIYHANGGSGTTSDTPLANGILKPAVVVLTAQNLGTRIWQICANLPKILLKKVDKKQNWSILVKRIYKDSSQNFYRIKDMG